MSKKITTSTPPIEYDREQGWNRNTELSVNLKTLLHSDRRMKPRKEYPGVLRCDTDTVVEEFRYRDPHFTFIETLTATGGKRNPQVFEGRYITLTRWDDGSLHPNFKRVAMDRDFSVDAYAIAVCNELRRALKGLVEEE